MIAKLIGCTVTCRTVRPSKRRWKALVHGTPAETRFRLPFCRRACIEPRPVRLMTSFFSRVFRSAPEPQAEPDAPTALQSGPRPVAVTPDIAVESATVQWTARDGAYWQDRTAHVLDRLRSEWSKDAEGANAEMSTIAKRARIRSKLVTSPRGGNAEVR